MNFKHIYLAGAIVFFVIIAIVFFENVAGGIVTNMYVFGGYKSFSGAYFLISLLSVLEGVCITLFVQQQISDTQDRVESRGLDL